MAELVDLLREADVRVLVDVRRYPMSRRNPQFGRERLSAALRDAGITYRHEADLGGHREPLPDSPNTAWRDPAFRGYADHMATSAFQEALDRLLARAHPAVMCAEALPTRCHRQLLADALACRGARVRHLIAAGQAEDHRLHPRARCADGRVVYVAAGQMTL